MFSYSFRISAAAFVPWLLALAGCSAEKITELADKAKQAVGEQTDKVTQAVQEKAGVATDAAKQQLALAGNCEVQLDVPIITTACYARFVTVGGGRPNVAQLRSYRDASQETFPSVMLQAQVPAGGWSELVGQTVRAELFVQNAASSPVWSCPTGTQVDFKVLSATDQLLSAAVVGGNLRDSGSGSDHAVTARFTGVLE